MAAFLGGSPAPPGAFEILRATRQLPVVEKELVFGRRSTAAAAARSTAGAAWGKGARKWVSATASDNSKEFGDAMPRELRTLVATSFDVFTRVSQHPQQLSAFGIARASREYREALKTCIFAIEDRLEPQNADMEDTTEDEEGFVDLLKVSLAIWHLCELLLLRGGARSGDRWLAYNLAQWLQEHYASALLEQLETESLRLKQETLAEQDPAFWPTIQSLVMVGSGASAWSLLATHSSYKSLFARDASSLTGASTKTSFQAVQRLLQSIPGSRAGNADVSMEDDGPAEWKSWHDACQYLLNTDSYVRSSGELSTLLEIMLAKEDALKSHASSWYELMMARLFLEEPKTIAHRFEFLMANCFRAYHGDETSMGNFDCIILAIMQYDIQSALQDIIALGFSWMAAHLADLLQKGKVITADDVLPDTECSIRERFLLQYAMEIGASSGMWHFAVRYYEQCPRFGAIAIRSALEREPVMTDLKADRLIGYCQGKQRLVEVQRRIASHRAQSCQTKKAYAAAFHWMLRGNHLDDVDALCDVILQECSITNSLTPLHEAVEFMDSQPELARPQKLAWLVRYRKFHLVIDDRESLQRQLSAEDSPSSIATKERTDLEANFRFVSMEAAKRLDWLLCSTEAPKALRAEMLQQAERLLTESPTVFASQHLYSLMAYLQQLDRSFDRQQFYDSALNQQLKERVETLLSRNLAEAMLLEATNSGCGAISASKAGRRQLDTTLVAPQPYLIAGASFTPMDS
ncbi:hypothetical protein BBJ28_00007389 [Nothophytophthora sp. Chile5]|nr:hypothetical protein BBJ28_00007389 [Nothophytophthora sp. Chile5]